MVLKNLHFFDAFRNSKFRVFWISLILGPMGIGRSIETVVLGWWIFETTNSPFLLGLVWAVKWFPRALAIFTGAVTGRTNRRSLLIIVEVISTAASFLLAIIASIPQSELWYILILQFVSGVTRTLYWPTYQMFVQDLVGRDNLMNALALNHVDMSLMTILGSPLGGFLVGRIGVSGCYYLIAALNLLEIFILATISVTSKQQLEKKFTLVNLAEGFRYTLKNKPILATIMVALSLNLFFAPKMSMTPVFAKDILKVDAIGLGLLTGAQGLGRLIGSISLATLGNFKRKGLFFLVTAEVGVVFTILFASSSSFTLSLILGIGMGAMGATFEPITSTLLLNNLSEDVRSAVMGIRQECVFGIPVGTMITGIISSSMGVSWAVTIGAILYGLMLLMIAIRIPTFRSLS